MILKLHCGNYPHEREARSLGGMNVHQIFTSPLRKWDFVSFYMEMNEVSTNNRDPFIAVRDAGGQKWATTPHPHCQNSTVLIQDGAVVYRTSDN